MELDKKIEALLFFKGGPTTISYLSRILSCSEQLIHEAVETLNQQLSDRGIVLLVKDNEIMLGTHPDLSALLTDIKKEELEKDLSKANIETLTIICYRGPITKSAIDYIRGVNSQFILRNLQVRGLIERVPNPKDARSFLYKPTFSLLQYLGVAAVGELPEYDLYRGEVEMFEKDAADET